MKGNKNDLLKDNKKSNIPKEFIIWGIKENKTDEEVLQENCKNEEECSEIIEILKKDYKCRDLRIQIIDFNKNFNFAKEVL